MHCDDAPPAPLQLTRQKGFYKLETSRGPSGPLPPLPMGLHGVDGAAALAMAFADSKKSFV